MPRESKTGISHSASPAKFTGGNGPDDLLGGKPAQPPVLVEADKDEWQSSGDDLPPMRTNIRRQFAASVMACLSDEKKAELTAIVSGEQVIDGKKAG